MRTVRTPEALGLTPITRFRNTPDKSRWNPKKVPDYYRVNHITLADLTGPFAKTHEFRLVNEQEGILAMLPIR
jgi:hypothetical protein